MITHIIICQSPFVRLLQSMVVFLLIVLLVSDLLHSSVSVTLSTSSKSDRNLLSTSRDRQCPCTFQVLTAASDPPFDFVISSLTSPRTRWRKSKQRFNTAFYRDNLHALHTIHVPLSHKVRLSVLTSRNLSAFLPSASSFLPSHPYILPRTNRISTCPVYLKPHPPHDYADSQLTRIIGGLPINWELASYIVRFQTYSYDDAGVSVLYYCSGTLISPQIVITAAHCNLTTASDVVHIVADATGTKLLGMRNYITSFHPHPSYDSTLTTGQNSKYDIAYVRLTYNAPEGARFMKINTNNDVPIAQSVVRVAGFGATVPTQMPTTDDFGFRQVDILTISNPLCAYTHSRISVDLDPNRLLCAGNLINRCGFCGGDSGGPLIQYDSGDAPVLVGVVSASVGCAASKYPGIYVRTSIYNDFIPTEDGILRTDSTSPKFVIDGNVVTDDPDLRETPSSMPTQTPLTSSVSTPLYSPLQSPLHTPAYSPANSPWLTIIPTPSRSPVQTRVLSPTASAVVSPILTADPPQTATSSGVTVVPLQPSDNSEGGVGKSSVGNNGSFLSQRQMIIIIASLGVAVVVLSIIVIWLCVR